MNIKIPDSSNYALIALSAFVSDGNWLPTFFENGLSVFDTFPAKVDDFWKKSLGTIRSDEIEDCNLFLLAYSNNLSQQKLERFLLQHYYALLLQGVGYTENGFTLTGISTSQGLDVSSISSAYTYKNPPKIDRDKIEITVEHFNQANVIAKSIETIYSNDYTASNENYLRLRKGFSSFLDGLKIQDTTELYKRLHYFVRAIEAVIKPPIGGTTKKFIHRCSFFGKPSNSSKVFQEIYELRSAAEHLNPFRLVFPDCSEKERSDLVCLRTYQAEFIASRVYQKILMSQDLLSNFKDDDKITDFWKQRDDELIAIFGNPTDFEKETENGFLDWINFW